MIKAKKYLISVLFVLIVTLGGIMTINFTTSPFNVNADAAIYYSEEKYTNSDYLLLDDGTESLTKTIKDFSEEVKAAPTGIAFPELSQVIPLEYLESSEEEEVFQYNGKEYGFYVAKDGNYFDVLLIDFVYEFEDNQTHSNIEYKIRIKPILQQTFLRGVDDTGNYIWTKSELGSYTYYVANPRFLSVIQNENSLNYGDNGYNKINDDGVIIQQYRVNYGKISYATEDDLTEIIYAYEQQLIKFNILQSDVYNLSTNHPDCVIEDILIKTVSGLKSYSPYSEYSPHSTVSVPLYSQFFAAEVIIFAKSDCATRKSAFGFAVAFQYERGGAKMLRSIKKAFDMVKQEDPDTAITVHTIRMWCKEGKIKCLTAGNKILVDVQSLMDYIAIKE